ncbi:hypothetical protein [Nocardioides sp.]|uniref:hypothetical protein n=1 Tax=Nocardioides sp. TaxID=35761 RepID=UPI0035134EB7
MSEPQATRRPKHLIDPNAPRKVSTPEDRARLERVQRWVMSVLTATTVGHLAVGLVIGAMFIDDAERAARIGLVVIGGVVGVLGLIGAALIHRQPPLTWWVWIGLLPGIVGLWLVLG